MAEIRLNEFFEAQNADFEKYLSKSKNIRLLFNISWLLFFSFFPLLLLSDYLIKTPTPLSEPKFTFEYIYGLCILGSIGFGTLGVCISYFLHKRIKKLCNYENINIPFIYMFKSYLLLDDYKNRQRRIDREESIKYIKKCFKGISEWNSGNIPLINSIYQEKFYFIINDFKPVLLNLISDPALSNDYHMATYLMIEFCDFLYNQTNETLDTFYSSAKMVVIKKPPKLFKKFKIHISSFIENHLLLSQIIFTILLLIITYIIGLNAKAKNEIIIGWMFIVAIGSFTIFEKIRKLIS